MINILDAFVGRFTHFRRFAAVRRFHRFFDFAENVRIVHRVDVLRHRNFYEVVVSVFVGFNRVFGAVGNVSNRRVLNGLTVLVGQSAVDTSVVPGGVFHALVVDERHYPLGADGEHLERYGSGGFESAVVAHRSADKPERSVDNRAHIEFDQTEQVYREVERYVEKKRRVFDVRFNRRTLTRRHRQRKSENVVRRSVDSKSPSRERVPV